MFDSRIFYLQMTDTRTRPQLVTTTKRQDPRPKTPRASRASAGR